MPRRYATLLAAVALTASCSDATGPSDNQLIGLFDLVTVEGAAPPTVVFNEFISDPQGGFTLRVEVLGGTIEFYGDHEYEQLVDRRGFANDDEIPLGRFIDRGTWVRGSGNEIILESSLFQNLTTVGTHLGNVVTLEQNLSGDDGAGGDRDYRFEEIE